MIPRRRGTILFIGFSPRRGIPMMAHSSMARSALETMASSLSNEWSRYGIRAVCIAAGLIETEGLQQYGGDEVVAGFAAQVPMRRAGLPEEVAATIAFLASAGGGYITGSSVLVDGGADAGAGRGASRDRAARSLAVAFLAARTSVPAIWARWTLTMFPGSIGGPSCDDSLPSASRSRRCWRPATSTGRAIGVRGETGRPDVREP